MKAFGFFPKYLHDILFVLLLSVLIIFAGYGCDNSKPLETIKTPGDYSKCTYTKGLSSPDFNSAVVYYPCETDHGPFAASTLTGGWINTKEDMTWLADHLVTHGYIIIAMTPTDNMGDNEEWKKAHKAGLNQLISENRRSQSPIHGLVDTTAMQIMGFSKGGGGALLAAADMGDKIKSTQALAPYMDHEFELDGIRSATICYSGSEDLIATHNVVADIFNSLPKGIDRTMVILNQAAHLDWMNEGKNQDRFKTYITAWMKWHLDNDGDFKKYIEGTQEWLRDFKHYDANSNAEKGGCG